VPDVSLSAVWFQQKLPLDFLQNLEVVRFCGTYGDPCVNPDLINIVSWIRSVSPAKIFINTNPALTK